MLQVRVWPLLGLSLISPLFGQLAMSDPVINSMARAPVYLCQFGATVSAYSLKERADGHWLGLGPLEGWNVMAAEGGLVASHSDQLPVIGEGTDSLVQGGQVVQGQCEEARGAMPEPVESDETLLNGTSMTDISVAGILSIFNPGAWDAEKATALVDSLYLDDAAKQSLKAELQTAGRDPIRIARPSRQIERAIGLTAAATAALRGKLQDTRVELAAMTSAFEEQRQRAEKTARLLTAARAKATAVEKATNQKSAQLATAQSRFKEKDAELARLAHTNAALREQFADLQEQLGVVQGALDAAIDQQQDTNQEVVSLIKQLDETRARLARANKKTEDLRAGSN